MGEEKNSDGAPVRAMTRRGFLEWMLGTLGGITVLSVASALLAFLRPEAESDVSRGPVEVADEDDIPVGGGRVVHFHGAPAIVIRTGTGYAAYSAVCPHAGCTVEWQPDKRWIFCPCHAGVFDLEGNVVSGPPPRSLTRYRVDVRGGKVILAKR